MKREKARLDELRSMSYGDYILTPEWQETCKAALKRAGGRCQVCRAENVALDVFHTTYETLGCEPESDVLVLCGTCYNLLSQQQKLTPNDSTGKEQTPHFSLSQRALIFGPSALIGMGLPLLLHAPLPAELFGLGAAFALAANSPKVYAELRDSLPPPLVAFLDSRARLRSARAETGEWSTWDRFLGRHLHGEAPEHTQVDDAYADEDTNEPDEQELEPRQLGQGDVLMDDELPLPPSAVKKGTFVFSSVLERFTPTLDRIYLASMMDGQEIYGTAEGLCHVALAGSTDGGKSSIMRMLMAQLCKAGAHVLLLNPHYTRYDLNKKEDWTPFEPYLIYPPMECRKYEVIEHYLKYAAETLLRNRLEKYAHSLPTGKPYFLVIDELPLIITEIKNAPEYMRPLLREGRKVGIFLISASQDFLVKTIAPDGSGGAVRDCYRTAYYVGGDATTARTLLDMEARKIPEDQLGKGPVMLRCANAPEVKKAALARVPYVDNGSLYRLLGPSTYQPSHGSVESVAERLPQPVPTGSAKPHVELVRDEPPHHASQMTEAPHRVAGIPRDLRAAAQVYQPGMTFHDLGRALQCSSADARILWQELRKYRVLERQASPSQLLVNRGSSYQTTVEAPSGALPTAPEAPVLRQEQNIQLGKEVFLTQAQFAVALKLRKTGMSTGYRDLMPVFDLSEHHAKELNKRIRQALGQAPERESE